MIFFPEQARKVKLGHHKTTEDWSAVSKSMAIATRKSVVCMYLTALLDNHGHSYKQVCFLHVFNQIPSQPNALDFLEYEGA